MSSWRCSMQRVVVPRRAGLPRRAVAEVVPTTEPRTSQYAFPPFLEKRQRASSRSETFRGFLSSFFAALPRVTEVDSIAAASKLHEVPACNHSPPLNRSAGDYSHNGVWRRHHSRHCKSQTVARTLNIWRHSSSISAPVLPSDQSSDDIGMHASNGGRLSSTAKERWYARQVRMNVLLPDDLRHVSNSSADETALRAFLALLSLPESGKYDIEQMYAQLGLTSQADVLCRLIGQSAHSSVSVPRDSFSSKIEVTKAFDLFLTTLHERNVTDTVRVKAVVKVVDVLEKIDASSVSLSRLQIRSLFGHVLSCSTDALNAQSDSGELVQRILRMGERFRLHEGVQWRWSHTLAQSPFLAYEAVAYDERNSTGRRCTAEPPCEFSAWGFGAVVAAARDSIRRGAVLSGDIASTAALVEAACRGMPSELRRYTVDLCTVTVVRVAQEQAYYCSQTEPLPNFLPHSLVISTMTSLQFASHVHFALRCGNRRTCSLLLDQSRTRQQVLAVMQHTLNAGCATALAGAKRMLDIRATEELYVVLSFWTGEGGSEGSGRSRSCFVFDVRGSRAELNALDEGPGPIPGYSRHPGDVRHRSRDAEEGGVHLSRRHVAELRQALQGVPPSLLMAGSRSAETALMTVSPQAVPILSRAMGALMDASVLSWWALGLLDAGRADSALAVLRTAAERGVLPDMVVLVVLLEHSTQNEAALKEAIQFIEDHYAAVAETVFRAFVERAAATQGGKLTPTAALELLSIVATFGLRHFPVKCLQKVALEAPSPMVYNMIEVMQMRRKEASRSVAILHIDAVTRLVDALEELSLSPEVTVFAASPASKDIALWSSCTWCSPPIRPLMAGERKGVNTKTGEAGRVIDKLYRDSASALWRLALRDLAYGEASGAVDSLHVHKALRLLAAGCGDADKVVGAFHRYRHLMLPQRRAPSPGSTPRRQGRSDVETERRFLLTVVFVMEALSRRGSWRSAMKLLPPVAAEKLPPLLKVARLRTIASSDEFGRFGSATLTGEEHALLRMFWDEHRKSAVKRWRRQPHLRRRRRLFGGRTAKRREPSEDDMRRCLPFPRAFQRLLQEAASPPCPTVVW